MTQNNHNARSLVEQLSGIRLIAFLAIAAINLAVLSAFCILPINLEKLALANLLFFVTAIASLATLTISSLTASAPTKMALIAILVALCLWMVRWVSLPSELKLSSFYASVFVSQALLIFVAATIYQERVATVPTSIRFGVKDMLFVVATVAILIPTLQYVFSEWPIEFLFPAEDFFLILIATLANTLWTFAIMFLYPKQLPSTRHQAKID